MSVARLVRWCTHDRLWLWEWVLEGSALLAVLGGLLTRDRLLLWSRALEGSAPLAVLQGLLPLAWVLEAQQEEPALGVALGHLLPIPA